MATFYNNLPQSEKSKDSSNSTIKFFDTYSSSDFTVDSATFDGMVGFFASRGFNQDSAESMAYIIIKQAFIDGYKPFQLLETLKGLNELELSGLITEILNYNRYKTSSLGTASAFTPAAEVARNIVA